ncbi:2-succinyl-6-hydroxy-2,4-cyclohexadiene-1-carboxylate synthase [Neobacillus soli]|uniref:2-succinyl-6-hydroxy-2, 4-cyclohexadiene-1-carboxylate synthase n=1 Tax=Neobacillus soli TaxID=220688 RepID=UPI000824E5FF|nr:2-succinyl-6-hydroxy-2,4-cyclohexadiene-1-carboxylate synthase [Neobacillus soli]
MVVNIDGIHYHVEVCGDGVFPLVLLHGFTGDASTWLPFYDNWGKHFKLIVPDIIGHGKTESSDQINRYQIESAASDLKRILDVMGVDKVHLLGYSMGGRLALTFTLLFPERVRSLILESASPGLSTEKERELRRMKDAELAQFINEKGISSFVDYWEGIPLFSTMKRLPATLKKKIRDQRLSNSAAGLYYSLLGMGTGSQPSWWGAPLEQLTCEVLLLTGGEDKKFCDIAENMLRELKNATWIVIENSGHAIHVEEPEKFGTIVSDFLIDK